MFVTVGSNRVTTWKRKLEARFALPQDLLSEATPEPHTKVGGRQLPQLLTEGFLAQ